jgi:hypothetical protein
MPVGVWRRRAGAALALALLASPASATWRRAESPNFIVYSQSAEPELRQEVARLEDYNDFLRLLTGVGDPPPPTRLKVYIVRGRGALRTVRPALRSDVAGFYTAGEAGIAAFADEKVSLGGGDEVLFHEIAHHFMLQYRPTAYPPWYVEGFAEFVMTTKIKDEEIEFAQASANRVAWLTHAQWLTWDQVLFEPPPRSSADTALYYAQSWLLVHYLLRDPARKALLVAYLGATARGEAPRTAYKRIFGKDTRALDRDIRNYAARQMTYSRLRRASAIKAPPITVATLPPSADDLLLLEAGLDTGARPEDALRIVERVRAAAAGKTDDYSRRVLAKAEALAGDGAAADRLLDPLLAAAPRDAELLYLEGMRHLVAARRDPAVAARERKLAQGWFAKAHGVDQDRFQTLVRYAESLSGDPRFASENTANILLLAHKLAPQVSDIGMKAARILLIRGEFDEAERILLPLASNPHQPDLAAAALAMLQRARARQALSPDEPEAAAPPAGSGSR